MHSHFQSLLLMLLMLGISAQLSAQDGMTSTKWQEDLQFIHQTVHADYPFLFKKTTAEAFDQKVEALAKTIPELEDHEVAAGLARIIASFEYGHTSLSLGGKAGFRTLPLNLYAFNDGVFVEGIHKDFAKANGAKVTHMAGMPIEEVLKKVRPVIPAENDQFAKGYGLGYVLMPEVLHAQGITPALKETIVFTLEKEGTSFEQTVSLKPDFDRPVHYNFSNPTDNWVAMREQSKTPLYLKNLDKQFDFSYLEEEKTLYVRQSSVFHAENETIQEFYGRVFDFVDENDVEKMVLDVRLNGGGDNFNNKVVVTSIIEAKKINQVGKLFVILGRNTFSAAQNLVNELSNYTNAVFVGEPTGENINFYGDANTLELPNSKIKMRLSWAWWQDKSQWENDDWLAPHMAATISSADYRTNQDPVLAKAMNFQAENFILDPMGYISTLFTSGDMEKLQSEVVRLVSDPDYSFFPFEKKFDQAGHRLLKGGRLQEAQAVFGMNTQLFPKSATGWHSLATTMLKMGQKEQAKGLLQKVAQMAPNEAAGKAAKVQLEELGMD